MEIRRLDERDYRAIMTLWSEADLPVKPIGRDSKEAMVAQMKATPDFFLGAFEDNCLVGVVVVSSDLRKGWINRLAVNADFRHKGVARALIEESEATLRKHGIGVFCALIGVENTGSKKLFKKCGYTEHRDTLYFSKRESDLI